MAHNNHVELTGNIGSDPAVHTDRKGREFLRLTVATTDSYKEETTGQWVDREAVWHTCFAFSEGAKQYAAMYKKGMRVKITGSLSYRENEFEQAGETKRLRDAIISIRRIEPAPLPRKSYARDTVSEMTGTAVEFGGDHDPIPF